MCGCSPERKFRFLISQPQGNVSSVSPIRGDGRLCVSSSSLHITANMFLLFTNLFFDSDFIHFIPNFRFHFSSETRPLQLFFLLLKRRWATISIKGRQSQSLFQRASTVVPLQRATTQAELMEVLIRSFLFSNTVIAPQSRVFASQPTGDRKPLNLEFLLHSPQVISVMSMWTRIQPAYAANMWNEALNMRLGTEVIDKIRIQNSGYI
ncbi:hypothetical protein LXL04_010208 [Taraxacum kok-saghyz]